MFFGDEKKANEIMDAKRPVHQKELGRQVAGHDDKKWNDACMEIVKKGNMAKVKNGAAISQCDLHTPDPIWPATVSPNTFGSSTQSFNTVR